MFAGAKGWVLGFRGLMIKVQRSRVFGFNFMVRG